MKKSDYLFSGSEDTDYSLALAHGAGAGMDTPFMPNLKLSRNVKIVWLKDGDHSFKPRKASGASEQQNLTNGNGSLGMAQSHARVPSLQLARQF